MTVDLSGVFNFRDVADSLTNAALSQEREPIPTLRRGALYRSDGLNRCGRRGTTLLVELGVRRVLDLRTDAECERDGVVGHTSIVTVRLPMIGDRRALGEWEDESDDGLMAAYYLGMAARNSGAIALCVAEIIASALDGEPVVVQCTAGKDRTGIVVALVLALLGVDDDLIAIDYTRSHESIPQFTQWCSDHGAPTPADLLAEAGFASRHHDRLLGADPDTVIAFLDRTRRDYGSIAEFLVWCGVDPSQLDQCNRALI